MLGGVLPRQWEAKLHQGTDQEEKKKKHAPPPSFQRAEFTAQNLPNHENNSSGAWAESREFLDMVPWSDVWFLCMG